MIVVCFPLANFINPFWVKVAFRYFPVIIFIIQNFIGLSGFNLWAFISVMHCVPTFGSWKGGRCLNRSHSCKFNWFWFIIILSFYFICRFLILILIIIVFWFYYFTSIFGWAIEDRWPFFLHFMQVASLT